MGEPRFVTAIDPAANVVRLGRREDLRVDALSLAEPHWLIDGPPADRPVAVQVRAHADPVPARVQAEPGAGDAALHVRLDAPIYGVAPGQAAVLYDGDRVLGGGTVARTSRRGQSAATGVI